MARRDFNFLKLKLCLCSDRGQAPENNQPHTDLLAADWIARNLTRRDMPRSRPHQVRREKRYHAHKEVKKERKRKRYEEEVERIKRQCRLKGMKRLDHRLARAANGPDAEGNRDGAVGASSEQGKSNKGGPSSRTSERAEKLRLWRSGLRARPTALEIFADDRSPHAAQVCLALQLSRRPFSVSSLDELIPIHLRRIEGIDDVEESELSSTDTANEHLVLRHGDISLNTVSDIFLYINEIIQSSQQLKRAARRKAACGIFFPKNKAPCFALLRKLEEELVGNYWSIMTALSNSASSADTAQDFSSIVQVVDAISNVLEKSESSFCFGLSKPGAAECFAMPLLKNLLTVGYEIESPAVKSWLERSPTSYLAPPPKSAILGYHKELAGTVPPWISSSTLSTGAW